ncbi:MAG: hypothetical protein ABW153_12175 [Sedimenticola sp.]
MLLSRVPLLSVRRRLRHLADDAEDADRDLIIQALVQAGDSSQIEPLLEKARAGDASVFKQLAAMPLEDADLDYLAIPAVPQNASADTLFWHALVMARIGNLVELDTFFRTTENTPDFFQGSPWTAYDVIANIRPVPDLMQQYLLRAIELFAGKATDTLVKITVWAATGIADAEGSPLANEEGDETRTDKSDINLSPENNDAANLLQSVLEGNRQALELPQDAPVEVLIGNEIIGNIPSYTNITNWPVADLTRTQLEAERTALDENQLAWIIAHDQPRHVLGEMVSLFDQARPASEQLHILNILGNTADHFAGRGVSPWHGVGAASSAAHFKVAPLVDDIPRRRSKLMARRPPPRALGDAEELTQEESLEDALGDIDLDGSDYATVEEAEEVASHSMADDSDLMMAPASDEPSPDTDHLELAHEAAPDSAPDDWVEIKTGFPTPEEAEMAEAAFPEPADDDLRRVNAQILHGGQQRNTFLAGAKNQIRCWIGLPQHEQAAVATDSIPRVDIPPQGLPLTVELCWGDQTDHNRLLLPSNRSARTGDCDLQLHVPDGEHYVSAEIMFRFRGRAFEVVQVEAFAIPPGEEEQPHHEVKVRVQISKRQQIELPDRSEYDATIIWGEDPSRTDSEEGAPAPASLRVFGGHGGKRYELQDAAAALGWMNQKLFITEKSLVRQRANAGNDDAEPVLDTDSEYVRTLLRDMARHGAVLYNSLDAQGFEDPGERIQLLNREPGAYVPLEFVYDRGYPRDDARLCDGWREALLSDDPNCPVCGQAPLSDDERDNIGTICPLGFWSLKKIIERWDPEMEPEQGSDHRTSVPRDGHRDLSVLDDMLFASSHRVPQNERQATEQALQPNFSNPIIAQDWAEWKEAVKDRHPPLLLALPHHDAEAALDYLQIGNDQLPPEKGRLSRGQLTNLYVNPDGKDPGPIVLLLGCRTGAETEVGYIGLARRFQQLNTSIVLGTLAQILGIHAAPVARELINELVAVDDPQADFGTIMRRVRRRMLAKGYLLSLCLVALGDAEWRLTPRPADNTP